MQEYEIHMRCPIELVISFVIKHFGSCKENSVFDPVQDSCKIKIVLCHIMRETNNIVMVLQKDVPSSCIDTRVSTSSDGNIGIKIKTEVVLAVEQQRDPVRMSFPGMQAEHEVCCMSVFPLLGTFQCP
jgi:hypothetical protein